MLISVAVSGFLPAGGDDNGARAWTDGWMVYSIHSGSRPAVPAVSAKSGGTWSDCHSLQGTKAFGYVQCDNGPGNQHNLFNAVLPGDPAASVNLESVRDRALRQLRPPTPQVITAPPRGKEGLVGLPQFFWVAKDQWNTINERAVSGPVWAEVTATPSKLVINPGSGQKSITCQGPGTPYDASKSPDDQRADCTYLFTRSSAGLPGSRYQMTISVLWTAAWAGSGGAGGPLAPITTSTTFPLRVAEGHALIQRSS
jgi:hypothetical protein